MDHKLAQDMNLAAAQKDEPKKSEPPKGKNTVMAAVAYVVFFIPLLTEDKDDPFVKFHVKQGMALFVLWFTLGIVSMVPFIGWVVPILMLGVIALMAIGITGALKGQQLQLPFIGKYADNFKI
jgi:uncharacterized membrane protein